MTTNTPAVRANRPDSIMALLPKMLPELARVLPRHITEDRIGRLITTEIRKTPNLAICTGPSFFGALLTASALGLEPGINGEAYLVPYKDKRASADAGEPVFQCELIVGYQGYAKLFWQHPLAQRLTTDYVCERDHFVIDKGLTLRLEHTPAEGDRGKVVGYYAIAGLTTGALAIDYFTADQVKRLRGGKVGSSGDIADPEHWMERKTALRQVLKLMPKSTELSYVLRADEAVGSWDVGRAIATGQALPELEHVPDAELVDPETGEVQ